MSGAVVASSAVNHRETRRFFPTLDSKAIFLIGLMLSASGFVSPPVALVGGLVFGLLVEHP